MSNDPAANDLIERYLLEKLTAKEIRDFEDRLGHDREFARKLRMIRTFPEMMSEPARLEYEAKLAEAAVPIEKKKSFHFPKKTYLIWAVISFLVIIGISLLFIFLGTGQQKKNTVHEENVMHEEPIVKTSVPAKDTLAIKTPVQPLVKKEIPDATVGKGKKSFELLKPADGTKFSREDIIQFDWAQKTDSFTRFYIFSESHNQVVYWRGVRPGIREYKVPGNYFYPGKYYWYVGTKEEKRTFVISE